MDLQVSFTAFCNLCEHLVSLSKIEHKKQKLAGFVDEWRRKDPASLFTFYRLLIPHLDHERETYGIKETKLADLYISALALPKDSQDAHSLRSWMQSKHRDFGQVLQAVLDRRLGFGAAESITSKKMKSTCSNVMNLRELDILLDDLARGLKTAEERKEMFLRISAKLSSCEQKWLIRIVLKSLRLGLPDNQILKLLHPDAPVLFDVSMDLREIVKLFTSDRPYEPGTFGINLFRPFRPMLAEREVLENVPERMSGRKFLLEPKLDGERCQLHFLRVDSQTGKFKYWSRRGTDYTFLYGQDRTEGSLTPKIESDEGIVASVQSAVLDGEMVVFDPVLGKILPFGTLKTSAGAAFEAGKTETAPHPCLIAFDLVYLNGVSLLQRPLSERIELLKTVIKPLPGFLEIIPRQVASSVEELTTALETAVLEQVEGIIVKDPLSVYVPGRRDLTWIKIKPEYVEGLCDDLDVVIIGAYYSRSSSIAPAFGKPNAFLCGIWSNDRSCAYPFVKIGSGYNGEEWSIMIQRLDALLKPYNAATYPFASDLSGPDSPDLLVTDPNQSIVVQLKGAQLWTSKAFKTVGYTLRHPRFVKLRLDRSPDSSLTLAEIQRLFAVTQGTLVRQAVRSGAANSKLVTTRRLGKMAQAIERAKVEPRLLKEITAVDDYFSAFEFMVVNGSDELDKLEIEKRLIKAGGLIRQSPPKDDETDTEEEKRQFLVVAGKDCGIRLTNLKKHDKVDIVNLQWLLDSENAASAQRLEPKYMIHAILSTKAAFEQLIDKYGDYYAKPCESNAALKVLLGKVPLDQPDSLADHDIYNDLSEEGILCETFPSAIHFEEDPLWKEFERLFNLANRK